MLRPLTHHPSGQRAVSDFRIPLHLPDLTSSQKATGKTPQTLCEAGSPRSTEDPQLLHGQRDLVDTSGQRFLLPVARTGHGGFSVCSTPAPSKEHHVGSLVARTIKPHHFSEQFEHGAVWGSDRAMSYKKFQEGTSSCGGACSDNTGRPHLFDFGQRS